MVKTLALATALVIVGSLAHGAIPEGAMRVGELYVEDNETLGSPYRAYWIPEPQLHKFLESDDLDPMKYAKVSYYGFPIVTESGEARSVAIQEIRGGYAYIGGLNANKLDTRLVELGKSGEAYMMRGNWFGTYIFSQPKNGELMVSPVTKYCAEYLELKPDDNGLYPFVKFEAVKAKLKAAVKQSVADNPIPPAPEEGKGHKH